MNILIEKSGLKGLTDCTVIAWIVERKDLGSWSPDRFLAEEAERCIWGESSVSKVRQEMVEGVRKCGWKTSRYRLSSDALARRLTNNIENFPIVNQFVDFGNVLSLTSGLPVGVYDPSALSGDISFGLGEEGETLETLGKGLMKIQNCPLLRDASGVFGTIVSDSKRCSISELSENALVIVYPVPRSLEDLIILKFDNLVDSPRCLERVKIV